MDLGFDFFVVNRDRLELLLNAMELFRRDDQVVLSAQDGGELGPALGAGVHPDLPFGQDAFSFGRLHNHSEESGRRFLFVTALRTGRQTSFSQSYLDVLNASYTAHCYLP